MTDIVSDLDTLASDHTFSRHAPPRTSVAFDKSARVWTRALLSSSTLPTRFRQVTHRFGASEPDAKAYAVCLSAGSRGAAFETDNGRSASRAETGVRRYHLPFATPVGIGPVGVETQHSHQISPRAKALCRQHQHRGAKS